MMRIEEISMKTINRRLFGQLVRAAVLIGATSLAPIASADDDFQILSKQGAIESIDVQANQIVVGGVRYDVAVDANVEIGGSYGAFTLLQPGMGVKILMRRYVGSGATDIIDLKELAPGEKPKQY
jgi:hypothetical protein